MRYIIYIGLCLCLFSCTNEQEKTLEKTDTEKSISEEPTTPVDKKDLIVVEGNMYTEYYPGKEKIKFQGPQDENKKRHGKWLFFSENGTELSMTMYEHGIKQGHTIVKYPSGSVHYTGEYLDDKPVGVWKSYTTEGELYEEKDYGFPKN